MEISLFVKGKSTTELLEFPDFFRVTSLFLSVSCWRSEVPLDYEQVGERSALTMIPSIASSPMGKYIGV